MSDRKPTDEDIRLFRDSVGEVRPIDQSDRIVHDTPKPPPRARQRELDDQAVMRELIDADHDPAWVETGEELLYRAPGIDLKTFNRLRRGRFTIERSLDLHAMNESAARISIDEFILRCSEERRRCIKIIHGKGLRSRKRGPVLKKMVDRMLRFHSDVLAFASAPYHDGGTGAVYVLLRRR